MLAATLLAAVLAVPAASAKLVAMETETRSAAGELPEGWTAVGRAAREEVLELTFAVRQRGVAELYEALMNVSKPSSPNYGMHLSLDRVHALTAPDAAHVEAVMSFLKSHAAEPLAVSPNRDFITAAVTVEVAERMLSAEYARLVHDGTGKEVSRAIGGYHLPEAVAAAVDFVAPTVHVPSVLRVTVAEKGADLAASKLNTPKHLRQLYSVGDAVGRAPQNRQAVTAFLEQGFSDDGLKAFWSANCEEFKCGKGSVKQVGDAQPNPPGIEAMLDIESITGVAGNVESEFWAFRGRSPDNSQNEPFLKWLMMLSNTSDAVVPKIFSTSYGEDEASWSKPAATRLNVEFMKAGARGISLLYASGDEGANCKRSKFVPEGPGSSPFVTAVGGTAPTNGFPAPGSETAIGLSSGGFSNYWPMPDYQKDAVQKYLAFQDLPPPSRGYNTAGRAYPDIAAQATNFMVYTDGSSIVPGVAGTSCATPTASGIFALLNDARLAAGQSPLGFLNPLIYEHASAFNDITTGFDSGCGFSGGWPAKPGWDAVTGVGTPNFAKLVKVVTALPSGQPQEPEMLV